MRPTLEVTLSDACPNCRTFERQLPSVLRAARALGLLPRVRHILYGAPDAPPYVPFIAVRDRDGHLRVYSGPRTARGTARFLREVAGRPKSPFRV